MIEDILGVTKAEARDMLGISRAELNRLIEEGELHVRQMGHYRRIPGYVLRGYVCRQQALQIAYNCVRNNTCLEDLHAGQFPKSDTDDLSDIRVVGPHGEVPWKAVSRISDPEMKQLMKEIVNNIFTILDSQYDLLELPMPRGWDRPEWNKGLTREGDQTERLTESTET